MRTHKGDEGYDEIAVHDRDYDTEVYFYPEDTSDEKWDKAMHRLAEALTVIDVNRDCVSSDPIVTVNLSELIESKIASINAKELFTGEVSVDWLMDRIHLILAGNVTEDWFADYFVPVLVGGDENE
jgi:hypothetical protein